MLGYLRDHGLATNPLMELVYLRMLELECGVPSDKDQASTILNPLQCDEFQMQFVTLTELTLASRCHVTYEWYSVGTASRVCHPLEFPLHPVRWVEVNPPTFRPANSSLCYGFGSGGKFVRSRHDVFNHCSSV